MSLESALFLGAFVASVVGGMLLRHRLFAQHQAGEVGGRRAGWTYAILAMLPFAVIGVMLVQRDPGSWWMVLLFGLLIYAVSVLPWVAAFRYPEDERRRKEREQDAQRKAGEGPGGENPQ